MEPLAEENEKLKEAKNLSEKNSQRARREKDFAESNARDLEYQKGVLTEKLAVVSSQLKSASEQLERKTEQLNSVSKQKAGMVYQRMYFCIAKQPHFGDNYCAYRARC